MAGELSILHVTPYSAGAWAYGGIPRLSHAMARSLAARGHQVTICATDACDASHRLDPHRAASPQGAFGQRLLGQRLFRQRRFGAWAPITLEDGITLRVFPNVSNRLAYHRQAFAPIGLRAFLREHALAFDVAHIHACRNLPGAIAASCLRDVDVPYVLAPNGTAPNIERRRFAKRVFDVALGHTVSRHASRVLATTEAERRQLRDLGIADPRITLVPNPLDLDEFDPPPALGAFRQRHDISGPLVAFLGQLTPRKRVDVLVQAVAQLRTSGATLVVAGNDMGAESRARAAARQLAIEDRTRFVGLLQGRDRLELLADADVVVYPSELEIFGLVPLEALLVSTPVVVSNDSGCGEVVGSVGGGLVTDGSAKAIATAIDAVLEQPSAWRHHAAEAGTRVRARFGSAAIGAQLEALYGEVVRTH